MNHSYSDNPPISSWQALKALAGFSLIYMSVLFLLALSFRSFL